MAGCPGAGKSTVMKKLNLDTKLVVVDIDIYYEQFLEKLKLPKDRTKMTDAHRDVNQRIIDAKEEGNEKLALELEQELLRIKTMLSDNIKAFNKAKGMVKLDKANLIASEKSFLIDGTGGNFGTVKKQKLNLDELGYSTAMIYIELSVDEAKTRNRKRGAGGGRRLNDHEIERSCNAVAKNKESYIDLFKNNIFIIDGSRLDSSIDKIRSKVENFLN